MKPTRERLTIVIAIGAIIITMGLYLFLYRPLINKCRQGGRECRDVEREVARGREAISVLKQDITKRTLISEKDISRAIDELTRNGRSKGIDFTSITPGKIRGSEGSGYKILTIDMGMESTYKELAVFLGSLRELKKGLVTIRNIDIVPGGKKNQKLKTKLTVNMYLSDKYR